MIVAALLVPMPVEGRIATAIGNMVHAPLFAFLTIAAIFLGQQGRKSTPMQSARCEWRSPRWEFLVSEC